jgi:hypothetical protein
MLGCCYCAVWEIGSALCEPRRDKSQKELAMEKFSRYQQSAIKNYYRNREGIAIQRVQELVTELYLAEGKKRKKVWEQLRPHLQSLGLTEKQIEHLETEDKPEMVANLIKEKI